ncbi:MAG: G5 and 3D domain-containing protein [Endomicrobiales bacterium]
MKFPRLPLLRILVHAAIAAALLISLWEAFHFLWLRTTITADGKQTVVLYKPVTVGAILAEKKIAVGGKDLVEPPLTSPMPGRGTIRVIRVGEKEERTSRILPFEVNWKKRYSSNLRLVEMQKGVLKKRTRYFKTIYHDGREVTRQMVRERVTKKTVHRLVLLAKDGTVEKIYDLSQYKKMDMLATAYYPGDPLAWRDGTVTFLGQKMQRGIVAVDPRVIPLRTRVFVPGYGYGYAGDTGSAIKGKRIDLGVNNAEEEKSFMHRKVTVYLLDKNKTW